MKSRRVRAVGLYSRFIFGGLTRSRDDLAQLSEAKVALVRILGHLIGWVSKSYGYGQGWRLGLGLDCEQPVVTLAEASR